MRRLCVLAVAAAAIAAVAPSTAAGAPGELLSATPMTALAAPGVALPGRAWKISYRSTSATGEPVVVSGTVLVPPGDPGAARPLIGYGIGTQGLADRCAPSAQLAAGTEYEAGVMQVLLSRGWVLALTDYPGLGTPGDHTYVVGRANGPAVLDAMRAARKLPEAALSPSGPAALFGYSEGGGAVGAAAERQPTYAPDIPLKGASVGGVVADFKRSREHVEGTAVSFLIAYTAIGFNAAYPELRLDDALNARGRDYIKQMRGSCISDAVGSQPFSRATDFTTADLLNRPDWQRRLQENDLGGRVPRTPVLLTHARNDEALPFDAAEALAKKWCALGGDVQFRPQATPEHILGGVENVGPATDWLAQRFAGKPTSGCNPAPPQGAPRLRLEIARAARTRLKLRVASPDAAATGVRVVVRLGRKVVGRSGAFAANGTQRVTVPLQLARASKGPLRLTVVGQGRAEALRLNATATARVPAKRT